jgi:hypothetical protein
MKTKPMLVLVLALALAGTAAADITEEVTSVFNDFLGRLTAKHEALADLAPPLIEIRGELITAAAVILTFRNPGEAETFAAALEAEDIPYVSFSEETDSIGLISVDMMIFVMEDAIGL